MMDELPRNHTLAGIHFEGNKGNHDRYACKIDAQGFMVKVDTIWEMGNSAMADMRPNKRAQATRFRKLVDNNIDNSSLGFNFTSDVTGN